MITINGVDLSTLGLVASRRRLPRLGGEVSRVIPIAGISGGILAGSTVPEGRLDISGHIVRTNHETLLAAMDTLAAALRGDCVIRFSDITDREWVGRLAPESGIDPTRLDWVGQYAPFRLSFVLPNPTARAQAVTSLMGAAPALSLGTATSRLNVQVANGVGASITSLTVRVLDASMETLTSLWWTGEVGSGETFVVRTDPAFEVTLGGANVSNDVQDQATFPIANPDHGATSVAVLITGGASPVVTTSYRKRWW